jgi:hypothetical protein
LTYISLAAASLFNYEPRETTPNTTPTSTPTHATPHATPTQATPTHSPVPAAQPTTPNPDSESPYHEDEPGNESDREYSPDDMVIAKSYTPDLMRYADVDLAPQLGIIGVVSTTSFRGKLKIKKIKND